jgi:hypothetical protein
MRELKIRPLPETFEILLLHVSDTQKYPGPNPTTKPAWECISSKPVTRKFAMSFPEGKIYKPRIKYRTKRDAFTAEHFSNREVLKMYYSQIPESTDKKSRSRFIMKHLYSDYQSCLQEYERLGTKLSYPLYEILILHFIDIEISYSLAVFQDCLVIGQTPSLKVCVALAQGMKIKGMFTTTCLPWDTKLRELLGLDPEVPKGEDIAQGSQSIEENGLINPEGLFDDYDAPVYKTERHIMWALLSVALGTHELRSQLKLKDWIDTHEVKAAAIPLLIRHCQLNHFWWILNSLEEGV